MSEPAAPGPAATPPDRSSTARQVALGAIGFVATLALLLGLGSYLVSPSSSSSPSSAGVSIPAGAAASISPGAGATSGAAASTSSGAGASPPAAGSASPTASATAAAGDPVLVGAGDIADCGLTDDSATADLVANIPGTVFTAGDDAYPDGTIGQFQDCYGPTWGRFLDRTRPAPGNHDHNTKDLAGYLAYFGSAAAPDGTAWYSYDLGTWHVVVLDSSCDAAGGCGPDSPQGRWLAADLAASSATCTMAIWHHPRWSSGEHGSDSAVAPFWDALYAEGADVVVNGHDHDYERFAPQDPAGHEDRARGIREFVVGTGGAALRAFRPSLLGAANSELRISVAHGVIRFILHPGSYEWAFVPTTGDVSDRGSAPCH